MYSLDLCILCRRRLRHNEQHMNGLSRRPHIPIALDTTADDAVARVSAAHDGEPPAGGLPPVQDDRLGVLEGARQALPVHPAGDEVGRAEGGLGAVHDPQGDLGPGDGGLEGGHGLGVRQAAQGNVVHHQEEVAFLKCQMERF